MLNNTNNMRIIFVKDFNLCHYPRAVYCMSNTTGVFSKSGTAYQHAAKSPGLSVRSVLFIFLALCWSFSLSSSCVLCVQCYPCLWILHSWLVCRFSLTFVYWLIVVYRQGFLKLLCVWKVGICYLSPFWITCLCPLVLLLPKL